MNLSRQRFDEQLQDLADCILKMGTLVEEALQNASRALQDQDGELAQKIIDNDEKINDLELELCDRAAVIIATEQPVAGDLRHLIGGIRIITDLERIGDHAVHLAKGALRLKDETYLKPLIDIPRMADIASSMVRDGISAFIENDAKKAREVAARDEKIDQIHKQVFRELLTFMMENGHNIEQATQLLFLSRFLERSGDHVTNICEWIIYQSSGKHIEL